MILGKNMEAGSCVKNFCLESIDSPSARRKEKGKGKKKKKRIPDMVRPSLSVKARM